MSFDGPLIDALTGKIKTEVLHVGSDPQSVGGIGAVIDQLISAQIGGIGAAVPTWRPGGHAYNLPATLRALATVLRARPDVVVHVHLSKGGSFLRDGAVLALALRSGHPTVATVHSSGFPAFARRRPRLVAAVLRRAHVVSCVDRSTQSAATALLGAGRALLVANPLPLDRQSPPADRTAPVVLFAGIVAERKGVDVLLGAWPQVRRDCPQAECRIVGPLAMPVALRDGVALLGVADRAAMRAHLRAARVVVLPSRADARPMVLLEAIGAARPFVASAVGDIPALALPGSVVVPVGDEAKLAAALLRFLKQPELARKVGERGREYHSALSGPAVLDARWRELYALARSRRDSGRGV